MTDEELLFLRQLSRPQSAAGGWIAFVEEYSPIIIDTLTRIDSDEDLVQDRYLFVCEQLAEKSYARLSKFRHGGRGEFAAWLRAVVRNLCVDHLRREQGRRRVPLTVERLGELARAVFELVYWHGHDATQAFEALRTHRQELRFDDVLDSLDAINQAVRPWQLAIVARPVRQELKGKPGPDDDDILARLQDPRAQADVELVRREQMTELRCALGDLSTDDRLILRLRYEMGLTLKQTAAALQLGDHRKASRRLAEILTRLRERMATGGAE